MDNIPNRFYRVSAKALVLNESRDKFLVLKEESGKWSLPGGGIDWGESAHEALAREIDEEMGVKVVTMADRPAYFLTCKNKGDMWLVNVVYETVLDSLEFTPSDECIETRFVNVKELRRLEKTCTSTTEFGNHFDPNNHL